MAKISPNRIVYKVLDGQEIDLEAYLPSSSAKSRDAGHPVSALAMISPIFVFKAHPMI